MKSAKLEIEITTANAEIMIPVVKRMMEEVDKEILELKKRMEAAVLKRTQLADIIYDFTTPAKENGGYDKNGSVNSKIKYVLGRIKNNMTYTEICAAIENMENVKLTLVQKRSIAANLKMQLNKAYTRVTKDSQFVYSLKN